MTENNWRVIVSGNSGDGFVYRLEDVAYPEGKDGYGYPVNFFIGYANPLSAGSPEDIQSRLRAMLKAFNKPYMHVQTTLHEEKP